MIEARLRPTGPYSLRLTTRADEWQAELRGGEWAAARQLYDGTVLVRASSEQAVADSRFVLALDEDTSEFHRRFARDPVLGPSVRALRGLRPRRTATVAHALLRAVCGFAGHLSFLHTRPGIGPHRTCDPCCIALRRPATQFYELVTDATT